MSSPRPSPRAPLPAPLSPRPAPRAPLSAPLSPLSALHAFRQAFQHGRDLEIHEHVLSAAEEVGLDRGAVADAAADPQIKQALRDATDAAHALGVFGVPTVAVGGELFWGDDRLADAATAATDITVR